jgi:hypothetical protein
VTEEFAEWKGTVSREGLDVVRSRHLGQVEDAYPTLATSGNQYT